MCCIKYEMKTKGYIGNSKKCGVYAIKNTLNGKLYVGSTTRSFHSRKTKHLGGLNSNSHFNRFLQDGYNKGPEYFVFEIIEICDPADSLQREAYYMQLFKSTERDCGYNIQGAGTYKTQYKLSEEVVKNRSVYKKNKAKNVNGLQSNERGLNKPVCLYNLNGDFIRKYNSSKQLSIDLNWGRSNLASVLANRKLCVNRMIVIFENDTLSQADINYCKKKYERRAVDVFSLSGVFLKHFNSVKSASEFLNCKGAEIRMCCLGRRSRIRDYVTKYGKPSCIEA